MFRAKVFAGNALRRVTWTENDQNKFRGVGRRMEGRKKYYTVERRFYFYRRVSTTTVKGSGNENTRKLKRFADSVVDENRAKSPAVEGVRST